MAWRDKKIKNWNTYDLCNWVKNIGLSDKWECTMIKAIENTGCTGQDWFAIKSGKDLANSFDIKQPMLANKVYREFKKEKERQVKNATSHAATKFKSYVPPPDEYEQKGFQLQLFGQSKYWNIPQKVTANTTVRRVKELYKAESGVGDAVDDIVLISKAKPLSDNRTLGQCGIINRKHLITVKFKAHGGCFVNGTKILTTNMKTVNIEDISIGDIVLTYNLNKNKLESYPVKAVLKYLVNVLVTIKLSNKSAITCTPSHPFYVPNKRNWCCVKQLPFQTYDHHEMHGQLCVGDQVLNNKSELITIESIEYQNIDIVNDNFILVRTLQIDGVNHNYFANNILVHNKMGQSGVDVEKKTEIETGDNDYHFYNVSPGMNYGGTCQTYGCKAKGEPVCFARGFDENGFNPIDDDFEEIPKCPGCKKYFKLKSYYLYKCDCKIMYKKKYGDKKKLTYKPRGEKVVVLGKEKNGDFAPEAEYQFFKIWVYKPNTL